MNGARRWLGALAAAAVAAGLWLARAEQPGAGEEVAGERGERSTSRHREGQSLADAPAWSRARRPLEAASNGHVGRVGRALEPVGGRPEALATRRAAGPAPLRSALAHGVDPCSPVPAPEVPEGLQQLSSQGVTVAWPTEVSLREPVALAYLAAGLLEEAAALTATSRRGHVLVVLYPSREVLREQTGAPEWASGLYDGAVHVPVDPDVPFGVPVGTLRHELMHAQLHAGVGCMPMWFDEGVAMLFAGEAPRDTWMGMLRGRRLLDEAVLRDGGMGEVDEESVAVAYAQSLAMVLYLLDVGDEAGLRQAAYEASIAAREGASPLDLWRALHPGARENEVLDALARRLFGLPLGGELDAVLDAAICCHGMGDVRRFGCRGAPLQGAPLHAGRRRWVDRSREPAAVCYAR